MLLLKILQKPEEISAGVFLLIKLQAEAAQPYEKETHAQLFFFLILQNFCKHFFHKNFRRLFLKTKSGKNRFQSGAHEEHIISGCF